jgi:hypothetical protein
MKVWKYQAIRVSRHVVVFCYVRYVVWLVLCTSLQSINESFFNVTYGNEPEMEDIS